MRNSSGTLERFIIPHMVKFLILFGKRPDIDSVYAEIMSVLKGSTGVAASDSSMRLYAQNSSLG